MKYKLGFLALLFFSLASFQQNANNSVNDPEAAALLKKVSEKYKSYHNISAGFKLLIQHPKINPNDNERKLTDTLTGKVLLEDTKFNITINKQHIICDGKNIWTYIPADKEVQVNYFEESDDLFSPSKIFSLYKEGYSYQIKEKVVEDGKKITVVEMSPANKKVSYFKIDIHIDPVALQITSSKIYEKNGVHYIYLLNNQTPNTKTTADSFTFEVSKYPGTKVVDLR